jgi:hypothetical protein
LVYNDIRISTRAVFFITDNDVDKVPHQDIEMMFSIFNKFPENIVSLIKKDSISKNYKELMLGNLKSVPDDPNSPYFQITPSQDLNEIYLTDVVMINSVILLNDTCNKYDVSGKIICIGKK